MVATYLRFFIHLFLFFFLSSFAVFSLFPFRVTVRLERENIPFIYHDVREIWGRRIAAIYWWSNHNTATARLRNNQTRIKWLWILAAKMSVVLSYSLQSFIHLLSIILLTNDIWHGSFHFICNLIDRFRHLIICRLHWMQSFWNSFFLDNVCDAEIANLNGTISITVNLESIESNRLGRREEGEI